VNFVLRSTGLADAVRAEPAVPYGYDYFTLRGGLPNCRVRFERDGEGRVAFLGGSITAGGGWREQVCAELKQRFPKTRFDFINAGISSFGSVPAAFRFRRDVLGHGPVDLLFEEAAVNDEVNNQSDVNQIRGMEGIVRQARLANPAMDIVMLHFADPAKLKVIGEGQVPAVIANHERVAAHYNVPAIDLAREMAERIHAGECTWEKDIRDLHPSPFGHTLYANAVRRLFNAAWSQPLPGDAKTQAYPLPPEPVDPQSFFRGRLEDVGQAELVNGWKIDPCWQPTDQAATRKGFVEVPMLVAEQPGATLRLKFNGTAVGVVVAAGPDAGIVEYTIDDGTAGQCDIFFVPYSAGLHLNCAYVFAGDLPPGDHRLDLKISDRANPKSTGHAVRITHFLVNGPTP
jgi:sialidase-1